jgi:hypothetical protein
MPGISQAQKKFLITNFLEQALNPVTGRLRSDTADDTRARISLHFPTYHHSRSLLQPDVVCPATLITLTGS